MKHLSSTLKRQIAASLVFVMAWPMTECAVASPLPMMTPQQTQSTPTTNDQPQEPGAAVQSPPSAQPAAEQTNSDQLPPGVTRPVGTAVAPAEPVTGVAGAKPVGAAIAPGKQRRARSILIRVGVIVGGAVAVGTVVALSRSSPSRPK